MSTSKLAVAVLAIAVLGAAGCGGSSQSSVSARSATGKTAAGGMAPQSGEEIKIEGGTPLSHGAWISRGDAICSRANSKLSTTTAKGQEDFARLLPQAAAYERTEALELSHVVPPREKSADWQQIVTDLQKFSELSVRAAQYVAVKNFKESIPIAVAANKVQQELVAIAKRNGFKQCSIP